MKGTQGPVGLPGLPGIPAPPLPRYPPTTADTMYIPVMFNGKVPRTMCHHISKKAYGEYYKQFQWRVQRVGLALSTIVFTV